VKREAAADFEKNDEFVVKEFMLTGLG